MTDTASNEPSATTDGYAVDVPPETGGLVPYSLGELFGPCRCDRDGCRKEAWVIWMQPDEYRTAKSQDSVHPTNYVFEHGIGESLCEDHRPKVTA
jgi:hypothetical protein